MLPGAAMKAARISRPMAVRMGMFCRLGAVLDKAAGGGAYLVEGGVDAAFRVG